MSGGRAAAGGDPLAVLSTLTVAVVADVLDRLGLRHQVLDERIRPRAGAPRLLGPAHTMQAVPTAVCEDNPYTGELKAVDAVSDGCVVVVSTGGADNVAIWGGLLATRAGAGGAVGAVVDGGVRDLAELRELEFTTYAASISARDSFGRLEVIHHGRPVMCGGVSVAPGDLVMADEDGVVVISKEVTAEVSAAAAAKRQKERRSAELLRDGTDAAEVYDRYGVL